MAQILSPQQLNYLFQLNIVNLLCRALEDLRQSLLKLALAQSDTIRHTDKICVLEFDTGPLIAVIEEHINRLCLHLLIEFFCRCTQPWIIHIGSSQNHFKRSDRAWQEHAVL